MKSYRKELWFNTTRRREFINITPEVNRCLRESGVQEGFVLVNAMHITASVFINDDEFPGLGITGRWSQVCSLDTILNLFSLNRSA